MFLKKIILLSSLFVAFGYSAIRTELLFGFSQTFYLGGGGPTGTGAVYAWPLVDQWNKYVDNGPELLFKAGFQPTKWPLTFGVMFGGYPMILSRTTFGGSTVDSYWVSPIKAFIELSPAEKGGLYLNVGAGADLLHSVRLGKAPLTEIALGYTFGFGVKIKIHRYVYLPIGVQAQVFETQRGLNVMGAAHIGLMISWGAES